jgi:hypothetical protein
MEKQRVQFAYFPNGDLKVNHLEAIDLDVYGMTAIYLWNKYVHEEETDMSEMDNEYLKNFVDEFFENEKEICDDEDSMPNYEDMPDRIGDLIAHDGSWFIFDDNNKQILDYDTLSTSISEIFENAISKLA